MMFPLLFGGRKGGQTSQLHLSLINLSDGVEKCSFDKQEARRLRISTQGCQVAPGRGDAGGGVCGLDGGRAVELELRETGCSLSQKFGCVRSAVDRIHRNHAKYLFIGWKVFCPPGFPLKVELT